MKVVIYEALLTPHKRNVPNYDYFKIELSFLVKDIISYLVKKDMWFDTSIYVNGVCFSSIRPDIDSSQYFCGTEETQNKLGQFYCYDDDVKKYTQFSNGIVTMIFEGPLYHIFNYYMDSSYCNEIIDGFNKILQKYGLYYEMGNAWNLGLYEISEGSFLKTRYTRMISAYAGWNKSHERLFNQHS